MFLAGRYVGREIVLVSDGPPAIWSGAIVCLWYLFRRSPFQIIANCRDGIDVLCL